MAPACAAVLLLPLTGCHIRLPPIAGMPDMLVHSMKNGGIKFTAAFTEYKGTQPVNICVLQEDFHEVTKDYPDAWHSMNLVAEHRLRMLHSSPVYKGWSLNQKQQTAPSSLLSIKIEQVLEVRLFCNALYREAQYSSPSGFLEGNASVAFYAFYCSIKRHSCFISLLSFCNAPSICCYMRRMYAGRQVLVTHQDIEAQLSSTDKGHVYSSLYLRQSFSFQCVSTVLTRSHV